MPKDTFFNLPEDKRITICKVAVNEFAKYPFDQASINRIVAKSGIAKGSFYQYFEDKKDLFLYIVHLAGEEKLKYMSPLIQNPNKHDVFTLIRELYISGIQFVIEHPEYAEIGKRILEYKHAPIFKEMMDDNLPTVHEFFEALLGNAIASGEVREGINIKMLAYIISSMNTLIVEYYTEHVAQNFSENMMETVDDFLDFLRNGIGNNLTGSQI